MDEFLFGETTHFFGVEAERENEDREIIWFVAQVTAESFNTFG